MNRYHLEILEEIKKADKIDSSWHHGASYLGSDRIRHGLNNPQKTVIAKTWAMSHQDIKINDLIELLNSLYAGESYEEKTIGGYILSYFTKLRKEIQPIILDKWLNDLAGWAEIDSLCQSTFTEKDMMPNWIGWEKLISKMSADQNITKRRASLVLLTWPVEHSEDKRFADLAIENIDKLKLEKDILITKAISWLLRSMVKNHRQVVEEYLKVNQTTLPKIAIRETTQKLKIGKK